MEHFAKRFDYNVDAKRAEANREEADANETAKAEDGSEANEIESFVTTTAEDDLTLDMENLSLNDVDKEEQKADSDHSEATGQVC